MMEYSDSRFKEMQTQLHEYFHDYFSNEDYLLNAFRLGFSLEKPEDNSHESQNNINMECNE